MPQSPAAAAASPAGAGAAAQEQAATTAAQHSTPPAAAPQLTPIKRPASLGSGQQQQADASKRQHVQAAGGGGAAATAAAAGGGGAGAVVAAGGGGAAAAAAGSPASGQVIHGRDRADPTAFYEALSKRLQGNAGLRGSLTSTIQAVLKALKLQCRFHEKKLPRKLEFHITPQQQQQQQQQQQLAHRSGFVPKHERLQQQQRMLLQQQRMLLQQQQQQQEQEQEQELRDAMAGPWFKVLFSSQQKLPTPSNSAARVRQLPVEDGMAVVTVWDFGAVISPDPDSLQLDNGELVWIPGRVRFSGSICGSKSKDEAFERAWVAIGALLLWKHNLPAEEQPPSLQQLEAEHQETWQQLCRAVRPAPEAASAAQSSVMAAVTNGKRKRAGRGRGGGRGK